MNDQEILKGIANGNRTIIKSFYRTNYKSIEKYVLKNSGNKEDANDVFQDSMIILYEKSISNTLVLNASLKTFFFAICKNIWQKRLRKNKRLYFVDQIQDYSLSTLLLDEIEKKEKEHLYRKYFLKLSTACQNLLMLVFENKSSQEIASSMKITEGNMRKKKFDCKKHLLEKIEKDSLYKELKS